MDSNQKNTTPTTKPRKGVIILVIFIALLALGGSIYALTAQKTEPQAPNTNTTPDQNINNNNSQTTGKTAQLKTEPATSTTKIGETITLSIWVDSDDQQISTVEAYLTYPTDKFEFVSIDGNGSAFGIQAEQTGADGNISITRAQVNGVSGKQLLAKINLKAKTESGEGALAFTDESKIFTLSTEPQNILGNTTGTTLTIGE